MTEETLKVGVVTVSDRASAGEYEDLSGPAIVAWLDNAVTTPCEYEVRVVPDERPVISQTLIELADTEGCQLILTTGGTGPAKRDVTPEATLDVADKELPGFGEKNADDQPAVRSDGDSQPAGRGDSGLHVDGEPPGSAQGDLRDSGRAFCLDSILHSAHGRAVCGD